MGIEPVSEPEHESELEPEPKPDHESELESESEPEPEPEPERFPMPNQHPLSTWLAQTSQRQRETDALIYGEGDDQEIVCEGFNTKIRRKDMKTLRDGEWLN